MSLCVAWKYEEAGRAHIVFAADSCAVFVGDVLPYGGIKVLELPVRIISATDAQSGIAQNLFVGNYGMAFAGSYLSAFLLKELIAEVLTHLQFLGSANAISFDKVCDLVHRVHLHFHEKIRVHLKSGYEIDFFLGGFCPTTQKVRVAKFFVAPNTLKPVCIEILTSAGFSYDTVGNEDGQKRFQDLMRLSLSGPPCRTHFAAFRRLWDIIRDPEYKFVTGAVQYGEFAPHNFQLVGAFDVKCVDGHLKNRTFIRGTDLEEIHKPTAMDDFHLQYTYGNPFDEDIKCFDLERPFMEGNGVYHVLDEQITLLPADERWPQWYSEELAMLRIALGDKIPIEHIGSTSVAQLAAVPNLDILIGVEKLGDATIAPFKLNLLGYEFLRDKFLPRQGFYRKRGRRSFNLHIVERDSVLWGNHLAVRNYLRANEAERVVYSAERMRILNASSWTLVRYLTAKSGYLNHLIAKATGHE
ncbi:MAG: GrpB family protein [Verrucomicrobia bacterium]|nr:GrpB family protein [Verrucomicrobiota bacterium]